MNIKILLFGITRDIIGNSTLSLTVPRDQNVGSMLRELKSRYPAFNELTSLLVAVNSEYADEKLVLKENDEIALIPPVSGG